MTMNKLTIIMILLAIISFCTAGYFFIIQFSRPENVYKYHASTFSTVSPPANPVHTQTNNCNSDQLKETYTSQGAAGNIYTKIEVTNIGKTSCDIVLGDTLTLGFYGQNITKRYLQNIPTEQYTLAPTHTVYSQIHYPNGPQCQSGITQKQTYFLYFIPPAVYEIDFTTPTITIPICNSESEMTTIDIWPLSKSPIKP